MKESVLKEKSRAYALRIVKMCKFLQDKHKEFILSKQVLRSGTSIGANIAESYFAQSNADFISKLSIARKEAGETIFWLELLRDSQYLNKEIAESMIFDCNEILKMLTSSIKTLSEKQNS